MTDVPQLGPEVYVDDEDDIAKQTARASVSPLLSPDAADTRNSFITHGLDGAMRIRRGTDASMSGYPLSSHSTGVSPQISPRLSPHRPTNSAFSFESGGELGTGGSAGGSNHSSRRGSAAENVLEVLDNSAWGESIRRSFTMRRPSR